MKNSKQDVTSNPLLAENLKAIEILVADALQGCCYINDAENYAKYNFRRLSATFEAIRALNADAMNLLKSDGIDIE